MNKSQIKRVAEIVHTIDAASATLEPFAEELATLAQEHQERYDKLGERAQEGDRGQRIHEDADALQSAADSVQTAFDEIAGALGTLQGVIDAYENA